MEETKLMKEFYSEYLKNNDKIKNIDGIDELINKSMILSERTLSIDEITTELADSIIMLIRFFNILDEENEIPVEDRKPIKLFVNSPGGLISATLSIIDSIKLSKTPVWTINSGTAYSGGFFIFINGHKRFTYPHSSFLFHEGSGGNMGDAGKLRNWADFYQIQLDQLKDIVLRNTKISEELYDEHIKDDWWITAEESIELGISDEIEEELI